MHSIDRFLSPVCIPVYTSPCRKGWYPFLWLVGACGAAALAGLCAGGDCGGALWAGGVVEVDGLHDGVPLSIDLCLPRLRGLGLGNGGVLWR
ncbi:hypothetical protein HDV57DRAFT_502289 [Trichoderma longibrachiatum]|uniref:Uncharacterized protein n=1 Tax=Trichoderma longibrachiatum ATCC 18648 TaxID=983965 RepID=A0A2T4C143_TRILO|nr:hypothetical protein M440DRAFT_1402806 [Trichoderma longibrachiatum ATCC 18648]